MNEKDARNLTFSCLLIVSGLLAFAMFRFELVKSDNQSLMNHISSLEEYIHANHLPTPKTE